MRQHGIHSRGVILAAFAAMLGIYFFSYFQRAAIPGTIFDEIQTDLGLSATTVATLGSMFILIYGCMQLFVGMAADRYGGVRTLLFGGTIMVFGAIWFPLCHSVVTLYAARALTGLGASFMYLSIVKEIDELFHHRHFAAYIGLVLSCGYLGGLAGTLPLERAVAAWGWRPALLGVSGIMVAVLIVAFVVLPRLTKSGVHRTGFSLRPLAVIACNRLAWPVFAISMITFPIYFVIQAVLGKKFLQDYAGLSTSQAATFVMLMIAVTAVLVVLGGPILRLAGERRKLVLISAMGVLTTAVVMLLVGVWVRAPGAYFLVAYLLLAIPGAFAPAATALLKEVSRRDSVALAVGALNGLTYVGVAILMTVSGGILDYYRAEATVTATGTIYPDRAYAALFALLTGLALVSLATACVVRETRGVPMHPEPTPDAVPPA